MKRRIFISLDLPNKLIKEIVKVQNQIKKQNAIVGSFPLEEDIHLTFRFIGNADKETIKQIEQTLSKIIFEEFQISLGEIKFFKDRVIWIELLGKEILKLQKQIDEKVLNLAEDKKAFVSHITLVRIKKMDRGKLNLSEIKYSKVKGTAKSFSIVESRLNNIPRYETLKTFYLNR